MTVLRILHDATASDQMTWLAQVSYRTQNFLDKNRDFVVAEHQALMEASSQTFVHLLFPADPAVADTVR